MNRAPCNYIHFPTAGWPRHPQATAEEIEDDGGWGGAGVAASGEVWDPPANDWGSVPANNWGSAPPNDWGSAPAAPGGWDEPVADDSWGPSPAAHASGGQGGYPAGSRGRSRSRQGDAQSNPQPTTQHGMRAPASPSSLHPSARAHQMSPSSWGLVVDAWGTEPPRPPWAQSTAPQPSGHRPAWTKWASEAKLVNTPPVHATPTTYDYAPQAAPGGGTRQVLSEQQRSQILSSLLEAPQQQAKDYSPQSPPQPNGRSRQHAAAYPGQSQTYMHAQFVAEQQGILRSIQDANVHLNGHAHRGHSQQPRAVPQYADSWNNWGRDAYGGDRASTIPEEDEYQDEDDGWGDTEDEDGWGHGQGHGHDNNQRVRFSSNVSYAGTPSIASRTPSHGPAPASGASPPRPHASSSPQMWAASPNSSRTMKMATGTFIPSAATVKTTVFELPPPRNGFGENAFASSHGDALLPAERALYNQQRPTKERIRWGFNPDKDPRVGSLLRWVAAMSNGLAEIGVSVCSSRLLY